jgi:hypothetical protein
MTPDEKRVKDANNIIRHVLANNSSEFIRMIHNDGSITFLDLSMFWYIEIEIEDSNLDIKVFYKFDPNKHEHFICKSIDAL